MPLILIRGLPGSGKSTLARAVESTVGYVHVEADMYHIKDGVYQYDRAKNKEAHLWCQLETFKALVNYQNVVVSNTFTQLWEMQPYLDMAKSLNIPFEVVHAKGPWTNVHNVPSEVIQQMHNRWECFNGERPVHHIN